MDGADYIVEVSVSNFDAIGQCVFACVDYNTRNNVDRCKFGILYRPNSNLPGGSCVLFGDIEYIGGYDPGMSNESPFDSFVITNNVSAIAAPCPSGGRQTSSTVSSSTSRASQLSQSSTSSGDSSSSLEFSTSTTSMESSTSTSSLEPSTSTSSQDQSSTLSSTSSFLSSTSSTHTSASLSSSVTSSASVGLQVLQSRFR